MHDTCGCRDNTSFCPIYRVEVGVREHQYLRGTSGLPREKELFYVNEILTRRAPPGVLARTASFVRAVTRHALDGFRQVGDGDHAARLAVCDQCPECERGEAPKCRVCGCYLEAKARWASEDCPLGKWPKPLKVVEGGSGCGCRQAEGSN